MNQQSVLQLLSILKEKGEVSYIEAKSSLADKNQIGVTISAISNSASNLEEEYGYILWGIENQTWNVIGTKFNLTTEKQGKKGFIYPQILNAFSYGPSIEFFEVDIYEKRIFIARIRNCRDSPLYFNKIAYIRLGEVNSELIHHPEIIRKIINKNIDFSAETPINSNIGWIEEDAINELKSIYYSIEKNKGKNKDVEKLPFLNSLGLLDKNNLPNNTCAIFLCKFENLPENLQEIRRISYKYEDQKNGIVDRLDIDSERRPFILLYKDILHQIDKRNSTLEELDLFRRDIKQYNMKALEELLINAIVHRNWNIPMWIEVLQTPLDLEIRNPGDFRGDWDEILRTNNRPPYLNSRMTLFLKNINLMEQEGGGIKRSLSYQNERGLDIRHTTPKDRVYIHLDGKIADKVFARFIIKQKEFLSDDKIIILSKIHSGRNKLAKDINQEEFNLVKDVVTKTGRGGVSLKIKEHFLIGSNEYAKDFSNTHASTNTIEITILDFANKKKNLFTTKDIYDIYNGKNKVSIRGILKKMADSSKIYRFKKGCYSIHNTQN